ncbi:MAG: hypothetical protein HY235_23780 [Acidobacteria bacterium]|nr:hypothetical protein [Acidobacteriota bacterium]
MLPRKTTLTIASLAALLALADFVPVLKDYKVMEWRTLPALLDFAERRRGAAPEAEEQLRLRPETDPLRQAKHPIADPGREMDRFYRVLLRLEGGQPEGTARILHYGDSPTTADMITSDVRTLLQQRFGDGGPGFCLIAKPWAWYARKGVDIWGHGWIVDPANDPSIRDGLYGVGAVSFRGTAGAWSRIRMRERGASRMEVAYLEQPGGGQFLVEAGGESLGFVNTEGNRTRSGFARFTLPAAEQEFTIRAMGGPVRLFGVVMECARPGVVYHSLGVNGAYVSILTRQMNENHWREQLQHYRPHLVVVNYGTNESGWPPFVDTSSEKELREVIRRLRKALPEASILVMSPMDRGQRMTGGEIGTAPAISRLVAIQERVAGEAGCAFFNTFEAMGGVGSMGRWYEAEPRLVGADLIHPMPAGARIVGGLLYQALVDGYNKYKLRLLESQRMVASK